MKTKQQQLTKTKTIQKQISNSKITQQQLTNMKMIDQQLSEYSKKELVSIARYHHMKGYSSMKKADLLRALSEYLKSAGCIYSDSAYLKRMGYEDSVSFPDIYPAELNDNEEIRNYHSLYRKLNDYLVTTGTLYGITPLKIVADLLKQNEQISLSEEEISLSISLLPEDICPVTVKDSLCILKDFIPNDLYKMIVQCQGKIPYYFFNHQTVKDFMDSGYFKDEYTEKLLEYFTMNLSMDPISSAKQISKIQAVFRQGGTLMEIDEYLHENNILKGEEDKVLLSLLNSMFSHTRLLLNRGYSESEKTAMLHPVKPSQTSNKNTKIYPNSPCPCGSGKKYKKCCGKR